MENFSPGKSIINISRTVEKHHQIVPNLISFHALTGCDSVPMMFGIGKGKALSAFKQTSLTKLGDLLANFEDVTLECKKFVAKCFGAPNISSSSNRYIMLLLIA